MQFSPNIPRARPPPQRCSPRSLRQQQAPERSPSSCWDPRSQPQKHLSKQSRTGTWKSISASARAERSHEQLSSWTAALSPPHELLHGDDLPRGLQDALRPPLFCGMVQDQRHKCHSTRASAAHVWLSASGGAWPRPAGIPKTLWGSTAQSQPCD